MSHESKKLYEVGYRRPPLHSRFKPGHSGNPRGRPKGQPNIAAELKQALARKVEIMVDGKRKTIRMSEAIVRGLVNRSAKGSPRDVLTLFQLMSRLGLSAPDQTPVVPEDNPGIDALLDLYVRTHQPTTRRED